MSAPPLPSPAADEDAAPPLPVRARGLALLETPLLNKGSAFSEEERDALGLRGLLPPAVQTIEQQLARVRENYDRKPTDIERYIYLAALQDRNETLYYRFVLENFEETLPVIYTPTVGEACQRYSHIYRRPRGLFVTPADAGRVRALLENLGERDVRVIVLTDNERILGLGDLGAGGMGIPIGKLALYTAAAGIPPEACLPVSLDVGTDNAAIRDEEVYLGWKHPRLRGEAYDALVNEFVEEARRRWPRALIQWEDFANRNAFRLLESWRERALTFNDDIDGTGAVTLAGVVAAARARGERVSDQRFVFLGAGEAATGIATHLVEAIVDEGTPLAEARRRVWLVDRAGLVVEGGAPLPRHKVPWARAPGDLAALGLDAARAARLVEIVRAVRPTVLIGTSGQPKTFGEEVLRALASVSHRPLVMPLSNPTSKAECTPAEVYAWTGGRCLVATGSPFGPVAHEGRAVRIGQANNAFIFPGIGLGAIVSEARRVTSPMFVAAARALAGMVGDEEVERGSLYPPIARLRDAAAVVATAVVREALRSGEAQVAIPEGEVEARVRAAMWTPRYRRYVAG
jgi:malate dehydrogenase (oxaloacetate-decarboxylating)(NADP+)